MSETLIGVIIGGLIATIGQVITFLFNYQKWKKEMKIQHLRTKRDRLERTFAEIKNKLIEGVMKDDYDIDMLTDIDVSFSEKVLKTFLKELNKKPKTAKEKEGAIYGIMRSMKECLTQIDKKIEKEIK